MGLNPIERLQGPSAKHWFGTDHFGRDLFSRVVYGARLTLVGGTGVVLYSIVFGILIGVLSGYYRRFGFVAMRLVDVVMSFPALLLALAFIAILGPGLLNVIIAVGLNFLTRTARIIFGLTLKLKEEAFVEAIRPSAPATCDPVAPYPPQPDVPLDRAGHFHVRLLALQMASLDFLGVGVPPQIPSWGNMISEGRVYITRAPGVLLPGIFVASRAVLQSGGRRPAGQPTPVPRSVHRVRR